MVPVKALGVAAVLCWIWFYMGFEAGKSTVFQQQRVGMSEQLDGIPRYELELQWRTPEKPMALMALKEEGYWCSYKDCRKALSALQEKVADNSGVPLFLFRSLILLGSMAVAAYVGYVVGMGALR